MPIELETQNKKKKCTLNTARNNSRRCHRCEAHTARGSQCKLLGCIDRTFCHIHYRQKWKVVVGPSRIPGAGRGLFVKHRTAAPLTTAERRAAAPIFTRGKLIAPLGGEKLTDATFNARYEGRTAPYAYSHGNSTVDALCRRNVGSYVNDGRGALRNNAHMVTHAGDVWLQALTNIYEGDEIRVSYGSSYWSRPRDAIRVRTV